MKRLIQVCLFLAFYQASAQADFYNEYIVTVTGGVTYGGDLSSGCGSRFDVTLQFQDGSSQMIISESHGGGGTHSFVRKVLFRSNRKVVQVIAFGRAHRQSPRYRSCGHRKIGEGNTYLPIDTLTDYPCGVRQFSNVFVAYSSSTLTVDIQPVTNKLNTTLSLVNNNTRRERVNYGVNINYNPSPTEDCFSGSQDPWNANAVISRSDSYYMIKPMQNAQSFSLGTSGRTRLGRFFANYSTSHQFNITNPATFDDTTYRFNLFPSAGESVLSVVHEKIKFPIRYGPDNAYILPSDVSNRITLLGPRGNHPSFYHWVYSNDGTTWIDLPAQFQGKHRIQVSGYDIQGDAFWQYHNTNIFFKLIVDCSGTESEILTLSRRISAPNIVSVTPDPDRCFDTPNDGSFKIIFDRALLLDEFGNPETLTILVTDALDNTVTIDQLVDVTLEADHSLTWPRRLASDRRYTIKLIGRFKGVATFTDNVINHMYALELIRPAPVMSVIVPQPVHCYGGSDGSIQVDASGGVGNYSFLYLPAGASSPSFITFANATTHALALLPVGAYGFEVRDGNGCVDAVGEKSILVTAPTEPLSVAFSEVHNPLAFHYKDGYIETILTGGTPLPDQSYAVEWYDPVNLLPTLLYNNAPLSEGYQAELDSIGDGFYQLKAYDSQYGLAHPDHRAGCTVTSELFHVIEPPLLVVATDEWHFVSCYDYDDGEMVAHVTGGVPFENDLPYRYEWLKEVNGIPQSLDQHDSIATQLKTGTYRVRISDKNNITKLSNSFFLVEPDLLQASMVTTPISCSSGTDGSARATATGGTLPYTFDWSDGTTQLSNLNIIEGHYFVLVKDIRGCTATANGIVETPYPIRVDSMLINPQCYGYDNGSINLTLVNGTPPYTFGWSNGSTTEDIQQLTKGIYTVKITDKNNCISYRRYTLNDPEPVRVDLGKDRILCLDQRYVSDAAINDPVAKYQWSGPDGFTAQTSAVTLRKEGHYTVEVVDANRCRGGDDIDIRRIQVSIGSEFIVTTQAFENNLVTLVNISEPVPDSVTWWSPDNNVKIISSLPNKAELLFSKAGSYTLQLRAYRQGCEKDFSKEIFVTNGTFKEDVKNESALVEEFTVFPNPAPGKFLTVIGLREQAPIRIRMISLSTHVTIDDREAFGSDRYELPYNLNLASGAYYLLLETKKGSYILRVMITN